LGGGGRRKTNPKGRRSEERERDRSPQPTHTHTHTHTHKTQKRKKYKENKKKNPQRKVRFKPLLPVSNIFSCRSPFRYGAGVCYIIHAIFFSVFS
jgi:hypothetical protein